MSDVKEILLIQSLMDIEVTHTLRGYFYVGVGLDATAVKPKKSQALAVVVHTPSSDTMNSCTMQQDEVEKANGYALEDFAKVIQTRIPAKKKQPHSEGHEGHRIGGRR